MLFYSTLIHSGTTYFKSGLERKYPVRHRHFDQLTMKIAEGYDFFATTYRDPYRIGASWANTDKSYQRHEWAIQWENYAKFLALNPLIFDVHAGRLQHGMVFGEKPLNQHKDKYDLHKALDEGDLDYYHSKVPIHMIEFAQECCQCLTLKSQSAG